MKRVEASDIARTASQAACANPGAPWLPDALIEDDLQRLADFVESAPTAPAESVYLFAVSGAKKVMPWQGLPRAHRVAFEIFRATYLALLVFVREADAAADEARRAALRGGDRFMGERTFDEQAPGFGDQRPMGPPTEPAMSKAKKAKR